MVGVCATSDDRVMTAVERGVARGKLDDDCREVGRGRKLPFLSLRGADKGWEALFLFPPGESPYHLSGLESFVRLGPRPHGCKDDRRVLIACAVERYTQQVHHHLHEGAWVVQVASCDCSD